MRKLYLPFTLTLRSRAVLTVLGSDPNSARTLPYILGSAPRGALAQASPIRAAILSARASSARFYWTVAFGLSTPIPEPPVGGRFRHRSFGEWTRPLDRVKVGQGANRKLLRCAPGDLVIRIRDRSLEAKARSRSRSRPDPVDPRY
jgi:hypothetical protein